MERLLLAMEDGECRHAGRSLGEVNPTLHEESETGGEDPKDLEERDHLTSSDSHGGAQNSRKRKPQGGLRAPKSPCCESQTDSSVIFGDGPLDPVREEPSNTSFGSGGGTKNRRKGKAQGGPRALRSGKRQVCETGASDTSGAIFGQED